VSERKHQWLTRAYYVLCTSLWLGYFAVVFLNAVHIIHVTDADVKGFTRIWDGITDPVLKAIVMVLLGVIALILIPGFIVVGLWLLGMTLAVSLTLGVLSALVAGIIALARISVTGAIVAATLSGGLGYLLFRLVRKYAWPPLRRLIRPAVDVIYGIFFDWWLTPLLLRRKEYRRMDDLRKKREQSDEVIAKLQRPEVVKTQLPAPSTIAPSADDNFITRWVERFRLRGHQKTNEEKIKIIAQQKKAYAETRGAIDEYRGVLESLDELERVERGDTRIEKDEEAGIRGLDRKKRKLSLEREIRDLEKEPEEPQKIQPKPVDNRTPEQKKIAKLAKCREEKAEAIAACNGDQERMEEMERIFEDRRMRIMEEG
jgi:hypothetical protein